MVKIVVVSEYSLNPPEDGQGRVKIASGPLYELTRVQKLAAAGGLNTWTDRCDKAVYDLFAGDLEAVAGLLGHLRPGDYRDSEWCTNGRNALAACDAYALRRVEWVASVDKEMGVEYFVKFAVGKAGQLVLLVSCHLS
ncbi:MULTISPECIES: hypothetical protein [Acidovorax]|jgi:hypothetical protein|uniref:Uncharacterized protein n=1 Tax=Acidovorax facilis TaxID=12917 RepID=A0ABV8D6H4_9BURK|nr:MULTISPECIES: hypothetical protein [Acidovorax]MBO1008243.1 hypothetical protein [Acidovorax sp. SD340]MCO4244853.1 hypothetical protein [Acidovorax facilis]